MELASDGTVAVVGVPGVVVEDKVVLVLVDDVVGTVVELVDDVVDDVDVVGSFQHSHDSMLATGCVPGGQRVGSPLQAPMAPSDSSIGISTVSIFFILHFLYV